MPEVVEIKQVLRKESRKYVWVKCPSCGQERWQQLRNFERGDSTGLCLSCYNDSKEAKKNRSEARGGYPDKTEERGKKRHLGYVMVKLSKDDFFYPMADSKGYVREHRLIMAKHLNRCLLPWEVVHHKNGIRDDNRLENLELLPTSKYHLIDTVTKRYIKQLERENAELKAALQSRG